MVVHCRPLTEVDAAAAFDLRRLAPSGSLVWVSQGEGLLGFGEAARFETSGPQRFAEAAAWWQQWCQAAAFPDGTQPVVFGRFGFDDADRCVLIVPRLCLRSRAGRVQLIEVTPVEAFESQRGNRQDPAELPEPRLGPVSAISAVTDGAITAGRHRENVATAVARIEAGKLEKVVLARDVLVRAASGIDLAAVVQRLARDYPQCWTFSVEGLVGASPEMLVRRSGRWAQSQVLAGSLWPEPGRSDAELSTEILRSDKNLAEHAYAVDSAVRSLGPYCDSITTPAQPTPLSLPNVVHLATTVTGTLPASDAASSLELAGALHPTAAVSGTPNDAACALIAELEAGRGGYAGPVGWMDASGDGEWAIALRCAQIEGETARLHAGGGIVAGSEPDVELTETEVKLAPMLGALGATNASKGGRDLT